MQRSKKKNNQENQKVSSQNLCVSNIKQPSSLSGRTSERFFILINTIYIILKTAWLLLEARLYPSTTVIKLN